MVHQTVLLFDVAQPFSFYFFVFFGTMCSYNLHWYLTNEAAPAGASQKQTWHLQYKRVHLSLAATALLLACIAAFYLLHHWAWLLVSAFFTFLYTAPKIPYWPFIKLRQIAYGKTVFLALAWMHITTMLTLLMADVQWQLPHYLFALNRFFLIYAICILFDLRDRENDRKEGIKSMITQMSAPQVSLIYYGVLLVWLVTTAWLFFYFSAGVIVALAVPGLLLFFIYNWARQQRSDYVYYFMLDGLMVISYPLMLLFQF